MKKIVILFIVGLANSLLSQNCSLLPVNATTTQSSQRSDTTVCINTTIPLTVKYPVLKSTTSYAVSTIPHIDTLPCEKGGTTPPGFTLPDDDYSGKINIGFDFCFYNKVYKKIVICDNGFITFDTTKAGVTSVVTVPYLPRALPSFSNFTVSINQPPWFMIRPRLPDNSICASMSDFYLPSGGTITTETIGTAPFRAFIVKYNDCRYFACSTNVAKKATMKIVLYETTNIIDIFVKSKNECTTTSNATQGLQGNNSTQWIVTPGRNNTNWSGNNTGRRFTPNGTNYTTSVVWKKNGVNFSTLQNTSTSVSSPVTTITAHATINSTCPNISVTAIDTFVAYGATVTTSSIYLVDTILCQDSMEISDTANKGVSYKWVDNNSTQNKRKVSEGTYTLIRYNDSLQCSFDSLIFNISKIHPTKLDSSIIQGCVNSGNFASIKLVPSYLSNVTYQYNYLDGNGFVSDSTYDSLTYGLNTIIVKNSNQCLDTFTYNLDTFTFSATNYKSTCPHLSNGAIKVNVTGTSGPYTYSLDGINYQASDSFPSKKKGIYTIRVKNSMGCVQTLIDTLGSVSTLELDYFTYDTLACFSTNNAFVSMKLKGGVPPYSYAIPNNIYRSWGTAFVGAGTYYIKAKDKNNCRIDTTIDIGENPEIFASLTKTESCIGNPTGTIKVIALGGTGTFDYQLDNGVFDSIDSFANISNGHHTITIRDEMNCTKVLVDTLDDLPNPSISLDSLFHISCKTSVYSSNDGKIFISVDSGTTPYRYDWSNGDTIPDIQNLSKDTFQVVVLDSNNCTDTASYIIIEPDSLVMTTDLTMPLCFDSANGSIKVNATGGTIPFTYYQNNVVSMDSMKDLSSGTYAVKIIDANGCIDSQNVILTNPQKLSIIVAIDSVKCFGGSDGEIIINSIGGTGSHMYSLNGGAFQTNGTFSSLIAGNYVVSIQDSNLCSFDTSISIYQYDSIQFSVVIDSIKCKDGNDGKITVNASVGVTPFEYKLDNGAYQGSNVFSNLNSNTYQVSLKDNKGCEDSITVYLPNPSGMTSLLTINQHVSCYGGNDGSASVAVSNGSPPYQYNWYNGSLTNFTDTLIAANHKVLVTDSKGCTDTTFFTITQPDSLDLSTTLYHPLCFDSSNGSVKFNISGGTTPYAYYLDNVLSTDSLTGLSAGTYTVQVIDAKNCVVSKDITLTNPTKISLAPKVDSVKCYGGNDGIIVINSSGGSGVHMYSINNGAFQTNDTFANLSAGTYTIKVQDANLCEFDTTISVYQYDSIQFSLAVDSVRCKNGNDGKITVNAMVGAMPFEYKVNNGAYQTNNTFTTLTPNSYQVKVRDNYGCEDSLSVTIPNPPGMTSSLTILQHVSCYGGNDGRAEVDIVGGIPPYSYNWDGGSTDTLATSLEAGNLKVVTTDSKNCTDTFFFTILEPDSLYFTANIYHPLCFDSTNGSAKINVTGGTSPFAYYKDNLLSIDSMTNLSSGTYAVKIVDSKGCIDSQNILLTDPLPVSATISTDSVKCFGGNDGKIIVNSIGGVGIHQYTLNSGPIQTNDTFSNLSIGTYIVKVQDANLCPFDTSIAIYQHDSLQFFITLDSVKCKDGNDGKITVSATVGVAPFEYKVDNGTYQVSNIFTALNANTYQIKIKDNHGCIDSVDVVLPNPIGITSNLTIAQHVSCFGGDDGSATISVSGGSIPYTYSWDNGATDTTNTILVAGAQKVVVMDNKACTDTTFFTITEPDSLFFNTNIIHPLCFDSVNGSIKVNVTGGTSPFTYYKDNVVSMDSISSLNSGTYLVKIIDAKGCIDSQNITLIDPLPITASISTDSVKCYGNNDGRIIINSNGGTGTHQYALNGGAFQTKDTFSNLIAGTYTLKIQDDNLCEFDTTITIYQYDSISFMDSLVHIKCFDSLTGEIIVSSINGGTGNYLYSLDSINYQTTSSFAKLAAGSYKLYLKDDYNCLLSESYTLAQKPKFVESHTKVDNLCNRDSLGKIILNISGGTAPYLYSFDNNPFTASDSITKLPAGEYSYVVQDSNACEIDGRITITHPDSLVFNPLVDSIKCFDIKDGQIVLNTTGGTTPYQYSFENGPYQTPSTFFNLIEGLYTISIKDNNNCQKDTTIEIRTADSFYYDFTLDSITCHNASNGKLTITQSGGTMPYQYKLDFGALQTINQFGNIAFGKHTFEIQDANGCVSKDSFELSNPTEVILIVDSVINNLCFGENKGAIYTTTTGGSQPYTFSWSSGESSDDINNLVAGTYTLNVSDAKNCLISNIVNVTQPSRLTLNLNKTDIRCFGETNGSIISITTGGTTPYTYQWSDNSTTDIVSNLSKGKYYLTITDDNLCEIIDSTEIIEPQDLTYTFDFENSHCTVSEDGEMSIRNVSGGVLPYSFSWGHSPATSSSLNDLKPFNSYTITLEDRNGCQKSETQYIDTNYEVRADVNFTTPLCKDDPVDITVIPSNGSNPFTYLLGNNSNMTGSFIGVNQDEYHVEVEDNFGCKYSTNVDVRIVNPMISTLIVHDPDCNEGNIWRTKVDVVGGQFPYTYQWSQSWQSYGDSAAYDAIGDYILIVQDANLCTNRHRFTISPIENALYVDIREKVNLRCHNIPEGELHSKAIGGTPPYDYQWSNGARENIAKELFANTEYRLTVTDADGCRFELEDSVSQPSALSIQSVPSDVSCPGFEDGSILVMGVGGTPDYSYAVDSIEFNDRNEQGFLSAGSHTIFVVDANKCIFKDSFFINQALKLNSSIDTIHRKKIGESIKLSPSNSFDPTNIRIDEYRWEPDLGIDCKFCKDPTFSGYVTQEITLYTTYNEICIDTLITKVIVTDADKDDFFVPTAFNPMSENPENKVFKAYAENIRIYSMSIFNRWGEKLFHSDDATIGWDGKYKGELVQSGVYYFNTRVELLNGQIFERKGVVNLLY